MDKRPDESTATDETPKGVGKCPSKGRKTEATIEVTIVARIIT